MTTVENPPQAKSSSPSAPPPPTTVPAVRPTPVTVVRNGKRTKPAELDDTPILPEWLREWRTFRASARSLCRRTRWRVARGGVHALPVLWWLAFVYAWRGLWRVVTALTRYLYDYDSAAVRHTHAGNTETPEYTKVHNVRKQNLHARWTVAFALLVVLFVLWLVWVFLDWQGILPFPPVWSRWTALGLVWLGLGWHGRPKGRSLVKPSTIGAHVVQKPTIPIVATALCALGNSKMKDPDSIRPLMDPTRHGDGWVVDMELPQGVPAAFVQKNREQFAGAMRRQLGTVWPEVGKLHPSHLSLFISEQVMSEADQAEWPLLRKGTVDLGKPFPAFTDQKGEWVPVTLGYSSMVVGAVPRMGKTYVLREMLLAAGLDKTAKVYAFDGKGTGDLSPCALYAHCYVRGAKPSRPEQIEKVRAAVRDLREELARRGDVIDSLPREACPENKVTSSLIAARPDLNLGWIVVGFDETQNYFSYGDAGNKEHKAIRQELKDGVTELVKEGPALGIIVILATQQVREETIPSVIAQNAVIRYCLKIEGYEPNDRILGTGAYSRGIDAQMFDLDDKGIGYLKAENSKARIVRSVFGLDAVASEKVAMRGRALREGAGMLTGDAAGVEAEAEEAQVNLLEDVRFVFQDHGAMTLDEILEGLKLLRPALYGTWDTKTLGSALNDAGVRRQTIYSTTGSKAKDRGVKREWLDVSTTADVTGDEAEEAAAEVIQMPER